MIVGVKICEAKDTIKKYEKSPKRGFLNQLFTLQTPQ